MISSAYADITVGTTGDYAPFSVYNPKDNKYSGKDIKLIEAFAKTKRTSKVCQNFLGNC